MISLLLAGLLASAASPQAGSEDERLEEEGPPAPTSTLPGLPAAYLRGVSTQRTSFYVALAGVGAIGVGVPLFLYGDRIPVGGSEDVAAPQVIAGGLLVVFGTVSVVAAPVGVAMGGVDARRGLGADHPGAHPLPVFTVLFTGTGLAAAWLAGREGDPRLLGWSGGLLATAYVFATADHVATLRAGKQQTIALAVTPAPGGAVLLGTF